MAGTFLVGLIGADIQTSLSPRLHEDEAARLGLRYWYQLIDIAELGLAPADVGELVKAAGRLGFRGLNITHPCKQEVVKYLDELSPEAADLDAVNTVVFAGGRSIGHNTDHYGFAESFRRGLPDAPMGSVLQLGAGGAGAAVSHAIVRLGAAHLSIVDADADRAHRLAARLRAHGASVEAAPLDRVPDLLATSDGLVNATPVGMEGRPGLPLDPALLRPGLWVADIVYRPLETDLLRAARERGCRTLDGGGMVVHQAAQSLWLFTGRDPDVSRMLRDFESHSRPTRAATSGAEAARAGRTGVDLPRRRGTKAAVASEGGAGGEAGGGGRVVGDAVGGEWAGAGATSGGGAGGDVVGGGRVVGDAVGGEWAGAGATSGEGAAAEVVGDGEARGGAAGDGP